MKNCYHFNENIPNSDLFSLILPIMRRNFIKHIAISGLFLFLLDSCGTQQNSKHKSSTKTTKTTQNTGNTTKPTTPKQTPTQPKTDQTIRVNLPTIKREFRAAWVATVANINWPTKGNYNTESQKREAIQILDLLKETNFNAVIFQVRPSGDALYKSDLEPWSYYLTGEIGKAPSPYYDPLEFWISEAHKRGLELHIWLNPYRAHHSNGGAVTRESIVHKMPEQIHKLRNGMYWMDPSDPKVQNHTSNVIKDLVKRYDIDAIHIDDYFYPYKEYHGGKDFPDERTWATYQKSGGTLSRADWRRDNVNKFIKRIHTEIKAEKPFVKFGISPFGIWKPGYPSEIKGMSQYDELFADAKLWLNEGWCDYFAPQLYWKDGGPQSFTALLDWWEKENPKKRHLWAGLNTVGLKGVADRPSEIVKQIGITRNLLGNRAGEIHYSVDGFSKDYQMLTALKNAYREKTLTPLSPWIKAEALAQPQLNLKNTGNATLAQWGNNKDNVFQWVLYTRYGDTWEYEILNKNEIQKSIINQKMGKKLNAVAVKAIDRLGNESEYIAKETK